MCTLYMYGRGRENLTNLHIDKKYHHASTNQSLTAHRLHATLKVLVKFPQCGNGLRWPQNECPFQNLWSEK
jgi:hypothetical protein